MNYRGIFGAAALALIFSGQSVQAQSNGVPAEFPPSSFSGNQFVDSEGCAFMRAGVGGLVNWVPRVDRRRNQLCSFQSTFAQAAPVPESAPMVTAPVVAAPAADVGAPIQTVASITTAPNLVQVPTVTTATARSPRVVRNAPVLAAAPVVAPVAQAAPAPMQTRAELCVGKTGLQQGFVSASTGETIDCGGVPAAAPVAAVQRPAPLQTKAALCVGRTGLQQGFVSSTTGQTIDCGGAAAVAAPLRMTMAQICADMRATGRNFVNAQTGSAVRCGPQAQPVTAFAATRPAGPAAPVVPTVTPRSLAVANCPATMLFVDGQKVRCGPQTEPITTRTTTFDANGQVTRSTVSTATAPLSGPKPIPASNPRGASQREVQLVPNGYTRVWKDGRHTPNRGVPQAVAIVAPTFEARVSTRTAPVATTHRYVQVGTFANAGNAQALGQRFMGMGLPVGLASSSRGKSVVLGPFASANALNRGLTVARGAGFSDAYTRN